MTYSIGGLIEATDYNGFVSTGAANINGFWGTGSGDRGWGQSAISTVTTAGTVTATQWASLVNTLASAGSQTNTALTSRTAPVAGNTISILANVSTDITNVSTNRGSAVASGTTSSTWTGNIAKITATSNGTQGAWTITWRQDITWANSDAARYYWNAGGLVTLDMSFTANVVDNDPEWTRLSGYMGKLTMASRVNSANVTVAATNYTGFTRGGTGGTQTTLASTTGWYTLVANAAATTMIQINDATSPYTGDNIKVTANIAANAASLTLTTTWNSSSRVAAGETTNISGGTNTASPFTSFGTAPAVLCRYIPPSSTYLTTASWGTPTVTSTVT